MLHLAAALLLGACAEPDLDGTWRHPASELPTGGQAYELALGQWGPEVAGLVRLYEGPGVLPDPYLRPAYCTQLDAGRVRGDVLSFRFADAQGDSFLASLEQEDGSGDLVGSVSTQDASVARYVRFERIGFDVDRACGRRTEPFDVQGLVVSADAQPPTTRVAALYTGFGDHGRFMLPGAVTAPDMAEAPAAFALSFNTVPDEQAYAVAPTDGSVRFAYAMFLAFDDVDGDDRWDRGVLDQGSEPVLGVAADRALAYLEGSPSAVFPDRPDLTEQLDRGYSLVVVDRDADGQVEAIRPIEPEQGERSLVRIQVPSVGADLPLLEAE